jgi:DNA polymerase delta subunit 4
VHTGEALARLGIFDLESRYGPCVGIGRLARWRRAAELRLGPPSAVRGLLTDAALLRACPTLDRHLWYDTLALNSTDD